MPPTTTAALPRGRPRAASAESHDAILDAVYALLQDRSVRDLTMEMVARRAGVGKPTLYRWWKTKSALVVAMFNEKIVPALDAPHAASLEESIRQKVERLIQAFNGFFGKVIAELIAEGQSDPAILAELTAQYVRPRRAGTIADIQRAQDEGTVPSHIDPELVVDAVFGSLYFNLLLKARPLTSDYGEKLVEACKRLLELS